MMLLLSGVKNEFSRLLFEKYGKSLIKIHIVKIKAIVGVYIWINAHANKVYNF